MHNIQKNSINIEYKNANESVKICKEYRSSNINPNALVTITLTVIIIFL